MANSYISRKIDGDLLAWMRADDRKPLLLRGARQVGKSSTVRNLAKQLCQELAAIYEIPIIPGKTLLFLDEIQSSSSAISSLRFFYEKYRELHIIAAGSLSELAGCVQCL